MESAWPGLAGRRSLDGLGLPPACASLRQRGYSSATAAACGRAEMSPCRNKGARPATPRGRCHCYFRRPGVSVVGPPGDLALGPDRLGSDPRRRGPQVGGRGMERIVENRAAAFLAFLPLGVAPRVLGLEARSGAAGCPRWPLAVLTARGTPPHATARRPARDKDKTQWRRTAKATTGGSEQRGGRGLPCHRAAAVLPPCPPRPGGHRLVARHGTARHAAVSATAASTNAAHRHLAVTH